MIERIDGETAVLGIIGDPVAQVKAPRPLTMLLQSRGLNAVLVPMHVTAKDVPALLDVLLRVKNVAGLIVTVPHKQLVSGLGMPASASASQAGAVNLLRKTIVSEAPVWEADLKDGTGFVMGLEDSGFSVAGSRVAMAGAGGAGNAIAFALAAAGVSDLAIRDVDRAKQVSLVSRLQALGYPARDWDGGESADLVVNATPLGMMPTDALPFRAEVIQEGMTVADIIMEPRTTQLLALAQARGAKVVHGQRMMDAQLGEMAHFFEPAIHRVQAPR